MELHINREVCREDWSTFIKENPFASPFQTEDFYDLFNNLDGYHADVFSLQEQNKLTALAVVTIQKESGIKSFFSRRGIIYGGPLFIDNQDNVQHLLSHIRQFYKGKLIYIEVRNLFDYSGFQQYFLNAGFKYIPYQNFQVYTSDIDMAKKSVSELRM